MARPDFRAAAARRLSEDTRALPRHRQPARRPTARRARSASGPSRSTGSSRTPSSRGWSSTRRRSTSSRHRSASTASSSRSSSARSGRTRYQLIAGERRWRASRQAGLATIPALVEEIDDDTALEIAIIENLQREDLSPLDEATMYDRMIHEHGYSIRKLAEKLGKDKGYLENRLRLADAPPEIRELVSLRKDTPVPCLRAAEGRGPEEAAPAGRPGGPRRAVPGQAAREDRGPAASGRPRRRRAMCAAVETASSNADRSRATRDAGLTDGAHGRRPPRLAGRAKQHWPTPSRSCRGARAARSCAARSATSTGQPREVPDDREAQARERDRPRPARGELACATSTRRSALVPASDRRRSQRRAAATPIACELPGPLAIGADGATAPRATPTRPRTAPPSRRRHGAPVAASRAPATPSATASDARPASSALTAHARSARAGRDRVEPGRARRARRRRARWRSPAPRRPATAAGTRIAKIPGRRAGRRRTTRRPAAAGSRPRTAATPGRALAAAGRSR